MKYLHTMIRVTSLQKSLHFYCEGLGFHLVKQTEHADSRFTLAFLRADLDSENGPMIELTYNWDTHAYTRGDAYGHVAYAVKSIEQIHARLKVAGYDLSWGPGITPSGDRAMAFVDDPDGYEIELLQG